MKKMKALFYGAMLLCTCVATGVLAQDPLTTNRSTELRAAPEDTATVVKSLADKAPLQLLERKGAWSRVKSANDTGWVRMMHLRGGATVVADERSTSPSWLSRMNSLLSGSSSSRTTNQRAQSATVGIRGISEDDLRNAEPNPVEFAKMKTYTASDADARLLASQGKLTFRNVAYLAKDAIDAANASGSKK